MNLKDKHIPKLTLIVAGLILLTFFIIWVYKFGLFKPQVGTSTASSSILWGQFIVSLLAVIILDFILIILDIRKKPVGFVKLVSFWVLIIGIIYSGIVINNKLNVQPTPIQTPQVNTSTPSEPWEITFIHFGYWECSNIDNCLVDLPIEGSTTAGATIKMIEPIEQDIKVVDDTIIRDQVKIKLKPGTNYFTFKITYPSGKEENKYDEVTAESK